MSNDDNFGFTPEDEITVTDELGFIEEQTSKPSEAVSQDTGPTAGQVVEAGAEVLGDIGKAFVDNIPGYNRLASGINAVGDMTTDAYFGNETKSISQYFDKNLNEYTAKSLELRSNNKAEAMIGDGLAMMAPASVAVKAGAALKATKVAKFLRPVTKYMGVGLTRAVTKAAHAGAYAAADTGVGVLQYKYLESQDLTPSKLEAADALDMFAISFGARGVMGLIPMRGGSGSRLREAATDMTSEEGLATNIINRNKDKATKAYNKHVEGLIARGVPEETIHKESMEFFKDIGATNPENFTDPSFFKKKSAEVIGSVGKQMDETLSKLDDTFGHTKIGFDDAYAEIAKKFQSAEMSTIHKQTVLAPAQEALDSILKNPNGSNRNLTVKQLWAEIKDVKKLGLKPAVKAEVESALRKTLTTYTDDFVGATSANQGKFIAQQKAIQEAANLKTREVAAISNELRLLESTKEQTPEVLEQIKSLTARYNIASKAEQDLLMKATDTFDILAANPAAGVRKAGEGAPDYVGALNVAEEAKEFKKLSQKYFRYKNLEKVVNSMEPPKNADEAIFSSIRGALSSPRNIGSYLLGGKYAVIADAGYKVTSPIVRKAVNDAALSNPQAFMAQAEKVAKFLDKVDALPNDPFMRGLFNKFGAELTSEEISDQELIKKVGSYYAKSNLYVSPIARTTESANANIENIMLIADEVAPEFNKMISDALELEEAAPAQIGEIMDKLSKVPELKRFFKAGQGWDGKLVDPAEREQAATAIEQNDLELTTTARREIASQIRSTGVVPDLNDPKYQRQPKVYQPRDKSRQRY